MKTTTSITIADAQKQHYKDEGYFITEPLFDTSTLDGIQSEFQRMWEEDIAQAERTGTPTDVEFARLRPFFSHLDKRSPACAAFCRHPNLVAIASQMLGGELDLTWNQAIIKPPSQGKSFAWHQDGYYAVEVNKEHTKGVDKSLVLDAKSHVTFWIAITRTTIENGTLWVAPGMHKQGLLPHVKREEQRDWECQFDSSGKIPAELQRGQGIIFTNLVPHCSGQNVSNEVRMAYQIGYGIPGVLKNNYQIPAMRGGKLV